MIQQQSSRKPKRPILGPNDLRELAGQQSPNSRIAEVAVLGSMIQDARLVGDIIQVLSGPDDFFLPAHAAIYTALVDLYNRNLPTELLQLQEAMADKELLESVGGIDYLIELAEAVSNPAEAVAAARIVREKATMRGLADAAAQILYDVHHSGEPSGDILDRAEKEIFDVAQNRMEKREARNMPELIQEAYEMLERRHEDGVTMTGLDTGFHELNDYLSGLQKGEMIIVAARPSIGKTAFMLNIAEHISFSNKKPVGIFSMEMGKQQLAERLMCSRAGVDGQRMRRNMLGVEEFQRLQEVLSESKSGVKMYIDDTPGLSILQLRAEARRMAATHDICAVFIDYMQLMSGPKSENRQQEVSVISRGIKGLARELNIPVVALCQLNRNPEGRADNKPRMSDLRESGSIEQDADVVMLLHREAYYHINDQQWNQENPDKANLAEIIIAKQRNGPVGVVNLNFNLSTTRFTNRSVLPANYPGLDFGQ